MKNYLNILKVFRQKIPSLVKNLVIFKKSSTPIPRKTQISGHFRLNAAIIEAFNLKTKFGNYLIINQK
jgi:hypothetical protein